MATPELTGSDIQPREVADLLRAMGDAVAEADREIAAILRDAQRRLEALAWNRYAARTSRQCDRRRFIRRHAALLAVRAH
jgi:hypothetical protein